MTLAHETLPTPAGDVPLTVARGVGVVVHDGATHGFTHRSATEAYRPRAERAAMDAVRELVRRLAP